MEFERLKLLIGEEKLNKLKASSVLILGVGGVGGVVVEALSRSGIGRIVIIDHDIVDITNINRQIIAAHSTIGRKKVDVLKERIKDINPNCEVITYDIFYNKETKDAINFEDVDYIVDCCDTIEAKVLIVEKALKRNIRIYSSMGTGNKLNPERFEFSTLAKTSYDPIARVLRQIFKDDKLALNIPVLYSKEEVRRKERPIGTVSYMPSIAGLMLASRVINDIIGEKI